MIIRRDWGDSARKCLGDPTSPGRTVQGEEHSDKPLRPVQSRLGRQATENAANQRGSFREPGQVIGVVIDHQPPAGFDLGIESLNGLLRRRGMLNHAETQHHVVLTWCKWQPEGIGLHDPMALALGEVLLVGFDRGTQIDRRDKRSGGEQNLGESSRPTPDLKHIRPFGAM